MTLGIRGKEILGISLLVFLIVSLALVVHISTTTRLVVQHAAEKGKLQAQQIFSGSTRVMARARGSRPEVALRHDQELRALLDASIGYSPHLVYAMITDRSDTVLMHSQRSHEGHKAPSRTKIEQLQEMNPLRQLLALARQRQVFETTLPLSLNDRPFGAIRLGLAGSLLWNELSPAIWGSLLLALFTFPLAWAVAFGLSSLVLVPLRQIAQGVDRMARGEFDTPVAFDRHDEVGEIAEKLNLLGRQLQEDRSSLMSEKTRLEGIVHCLEDAIILLNREQAVIFANPVAEALLACPLMNAVGQSLGHILGEAHPLAEAVGEVFLRQQPVRNLALTVPGDRDTPLDILASAYPILDKNGVVGGMILLKNTEPLRQIQSLVDYSRKLADLGKLTSGVAHEVKNPLNAMIIHLELLKQKLNRPTEDVARSLDVLGKEIYRLDRVVQGFLRFVRPQTLELRPLDPNKLLQEVAQLTEAQGTSRGIAFSFCLDEEIPPINADHELLRQAFLNLVLNACQAMPDGGTVTLTTDRTAEGRICAHVIDQGVGIPPEDLDKIFRLYYTTKTDGNGIGLSLVYRIVQMHGGTIEVDSKMGQGTTMTVSFPTS
ncbi:PAS domain-containing sensor histidine kinase [Candidatus Methylomirabilis limnetica]|uniref:histidine kinase n=1 Tax=Candidatus Methylomirabilis limnetica TaxID=2033718 RepID=A0A2T4TWT0_9BACT|nr:ATP-binding protein [Candidatus Methylomirabilis limnetica]PTL35569.1 PAS domain-containing sensor histidine kinase [Candidatus Methylomirabilis limnetica]